jgi:hypothetical protein
MQSKLAAGIAHLFLGQYEEAAHLLERVGQIAARKALELDPSLTASALATTMPLRRAVDVERLKEGYVRAGFPP